MTAPKLSQFLLLIKKNFIVSIIRKPLTLVLQILFPSLIALLLLWFRGFFPGTLQAGFTYDKVELRDWPAGLEPQVLSSENDQPEFLLAYHHDNKDQIKQVMTAAISRLNQDSIKWYSYDEFMLDSALYNPVREINVTSKNVDVVFDEIKVFLLPFAQKNPSLLRHLSDSTKNRYNYERVVVYDEVSGKNVEVSQPRNNTGKSEWLIDTFVPLLKGEMWNHCNRAKISATIFQIAKGLACETGQSGRSGDSLKTQFRTTNFFENDCVLCVGHQKDPEASQRLVDIFVQNLKDSELVNLLKNGNLGQQQSGRSLSMSDGLCSVLVTPSDIATHVHSVSPKVTVVAKEFTTKKEMDDWFMSEHLSESTKNELERRLAAVEIRNVDEFDNDLDHFPLNFTYDLRLPPTRRNVPPGSGSRFENRNNANARVGTLWQTNMLKIPLQLMFPKLGAPACTGSDRMHKNVKNVNSRQNNENFTSIVYLFMHTSFHGRFAILPPRGFHHSPICYRQLFHFSKNQPTCIFFPKNFSTLPLR